jgi:hypothetical protein
MKSVLAFIDGNICDIRHRHNLIGTRGVQGTNEQGVFY